MVHYDGSQFIYTWVAPEYWVENLHAAFDANNLPWAGTQTSGLGKWNPSGHWTMYNTQNSGILSNEVKCLEFDASNKLWMGTPAGISTFDGSTWGSLTSANSALGNRVPSKVRVDADQTVWFGTDNGFVKIANGQLSLLDTSLDGYPYEFANDQLEAPDGGMWFLMGSKVYGFDGATWSPLSLPIQNYQASGICVDVGGILWISGDLGLLRFDGSNWSHFNSQNSGLADNVCYSPATDSQQRVWVATDAGLVSFDGSNWQVWNSSNAPFPGSAVRLVKCDPQDRVWVSYYHEEYDPWGGVAVMDEQGWSYLTVANPSSSYLDPILDIDFWGDAVWFTRQSGLARLEDGLWTTYSGDLPGFPAGLTFGSAFDSQGHLWVAGSGLGHYDGNSWQTYTPSNSGLADLRCRNVFVDSTGLIWISNYDRPVLNVFNYPASVANDDPEVPAVPLLKAWPNPFSESLFIEYELPRSTASSKFSVYNLRGQKVRGLEAGPGSNGKVSAVWDGRDDKGIACPSGIYLVRLNQPGEPQSLKVLKI